MIRLIAAASLLALALPPPALAQASAPPPALFEDVAPASPDIIVTATRMPTSALEVASSVTVFTASDIAAREVRTLPDLLMDAPGLNVVQTGGPGGQTSVFIRGANSNHVKVLVDGVDVSDPSSPTASFDFGQVLTSDIARVEILRGPQSGLYGSDAIGGVISITTKSGSGPPRLSLGAEAGSFGTFNQDAGVAGGAGPLTYALTVGHLRSDATPVTPLDLLAPGEKRTDDAYDNVTASAKLGYKAAPTLDLGLVARYVDTHLRFTGENYAVSPPFVDYPDAAQSASDTLQRYARASARLDLFGGRFVQTLGAAYGDISSTQISPDGPTVSTYAGDRVKLDWQGVVSLAPGERLLLGAEHQRDHIAQPVGAGSSIESGYGELQSTPVADLNTSVSVRYDANDRFGNALTYRIAPTYYVAATGTKVEASVGSGFKAPTLSEMFQNYPSFGFYGNPDLRPETSTGYDIGFEQFFLKRTIRLGATYFYNTIRNLITDNESYTSYANVGRAHTDGVESFISYAPRSFLTLRLDYTYTEARDDILHEELLRRPRNKWSFDARWAPVRRLALDFDLVSVGRFIDGNRDFSIPRLVAPGYVVADLAATYELWGGLSVYARITNLSDERYEDPTGYLRPGRGAFAGVKARY